MATRYFKNMKCVFTTNSSSYSTIPLLKAAINSLQANTTLEPIVILGESVIENSNVSLFNWLNEKKIQVIYYQLSFKKDIEHFSFKNLNCENKSIEEMYKHYSDYYNQNFIFTESLRIDIPILFPNDEYIMYADCDTLFLKDIPEIKFKEPLAAVLRGNFFNNGIMILNNPIMLKSYEDFKQFYINSNYTFKIGNTTTQGAYNTYYHGIVHRMPLEMNWHVFWGVNSYANIAHFCGPKPLDYKKIIENSTNDYEPLYLLCDINREAIKYYINEWNKYAESPILIS